MASQTQTASKTIGRHSGGGLHRSNGSQGPKPKGRKKHRVLKAMLGIFVTLFALGVAAFAYLYATTEIPDPESVAISSNTTVYYADGTTEIGTFSEQNREIIDCSVLPDYVGEAIISSEDRTFYTNKGIDLLGIARALWTNITTGSRQGGSTITQQYAERYYLGDTTTYLGKLREAVLAIKITQEQDKDTILCNYMNTIYLGRGAYGIQAAALAYFDKDAADLTVSEAALIAGIVPSPSTWDPAVNAEQAEARFERVISIMEEDGYITSEEADAAEMPETIEYTQSDTYAGTNGYLLQMVREELIDSGSFTAEDLDTGGYSIVTTIEKDKQDLMYSVVSPSENGMEDVIPDGMEFGAISVNAQDGSIIAVYAGEDYLTQQLNHATQSQYEIGSTMKPMALLGAIQEGVSLDTTFNGNSPRTYDGITDSVSNFNNVSYGWIDLYDATAYSVNTVYMDIQDKLGAERIAEIATEAGAESDDLDGSNAFTVLGNNALTTADVARMYATIANQGYRSTLHIVSSVQDSNGEDLYNAPTDTEQVFDSNDCALVASAMTGTVEYGTATEAQAVGHTLAMKTGTANDGYAASTVGFTPSVVSVFAMWYPDEDGTPQEIPSFGQYTGTATYPVHLFTEYMTEALADTEDEAFPEATDNGTIGGTDGTWGSGTSSSSSSSSDSSSQDESTTNSGDSSPDDKDNTTNSGGDDDGDDDGEENDDGTGNSGNGSGNENSGGTGNSGNENSGGTGNSGNDTTDSESSSGTDTSGNVDEE